MQIVSGNPSDLPSGCFSKMGAYRHRVFVEELGWDLSTVHGEERDQFDRPDTLYVVSHNDDGGISGCARLLPTTRPYLLGAVFPQLMNGAQPPASADVWELSRFAAMDFDAKITSPLGQFSSPVAINLMHSALACAAAHGAKRLILVSVIGIERLLRRAGFVAHRAGPPMLINGHHIFACWIEIPAAE